MLKKWWYGLSPAEKGCAVIVFLLIAVSIIKSGYYTIHYGGTDLRMRTVGARLLSTQESPYFYKWHTGDPEQLIDPNNNSVTLVNGVSQSPGMLYFQSLFTWMSYPYIRICWTILLYLIGISIFWLVLSRKDSSPRTILYVIAVGGVLFFCSDIWFYNIERGQLYILFPFFFCVLYHLYATKKTWSFFLAGVTIALATYCRPTFIVVAIPLLISFDRRVFLGMCTAGILLLIHGYFNIHLWKDYMEAMSIYTGFSENAGKVVHGITQYPAIIEGAGNLTSYNVFNVVGFPPIGGIIQRLHLHSPYFYTILYGIAVLLVLLFFSRQIREKNSPDLILPGILLYMLSEYIIPAPRGGYNLIEWLFPVLLIVHHKNVPSIQLVLIVTGLCLTLGFPFSIRFSHAAGEALLFYCLVKYIYTRDSGHPHTLEQAV